MRGMNQHKIILRYLRNASDSSPCLTDTPNWNREPSLVLFVAPVPFPVMTKCLQNVHCEKGLFSMFLRLLS